MATVQEPTRAGQRNESFVDAEIARASRRIRAHDVGVATLGLVLGTFVYALVMVLLDRAFDLPIAFRQIALLGYLTLAGLFAAVVLSRPMRRQVNPYYAARQVERAVPAAKNSVVNYLDLRDEPLPQTIKSALGARAASDLTKVNFDEVLQDRRLGWLGGVVAALAFVALLMLLILRPAQFMSLVGRAFAPFGSASAIAKQTELTLLQPAGGDATVPVNQSIEFRVQVDGRIPDASADDAVRLRMKYNPADTVWEERRLDPTTRDPREWSVRVPALAVQNGFVYQIAAGDAVTPEYRVSVRSSPLIEGFDVLYRFRPYLRFADQAATNPNLESLRGTQVTMTVKTNRHVKDGWMRFDKIEGQPDQPSIAGELVADQPNALRFRFTIERDGNYRIHFRSLEGDENQDPRPFTIKVLSDHPPQVDITRAAADGLAINGTLSVEGKASDDFGITKMRLCGRFFENDKDEQPRNLIEKPFRDGKSFRFEDGTFPRALDYKETLPLDQLKLKGAIKPTLKAGNIIEYWLEAEDNCDYPQPNVGKSKVHRVTLGEPKPDDEKKQGDDQTKADKQDFDAKQDQDLKNENDTKKAAGENQPKPPENQPDQKANPDKSDKPDPNAAQPPENGAGQPDNPPMDPNQKAEEDKARDLAKKLQDKLQDKRNEANQPKGESKPDQNQQDPNGAQPDGAPKGQPKPDQQNPNQPNAGPKGDAKPDKNSDPGMGDKGESKGEGNPEQPPQPGEPKPMGDGKNQGGDQNQPKPEGDQQKPDGSQGAGNKDQSKPNGDQQKPDGGQGAGNKDQSKPNGDQGAGNKDQSKPNGDQQKPDGSQGAGNKDQSKPNGNEGAGNKDQSKPNGDQQKPDGSQGAGNKDQSKPNGDQQKPDGNQGVGNKDQAKPDQKQGDGGQPNPGEAKPDAKPEAGANPGETKSPPKDGAQPGENKDGNGKSDAAKPDAKQDGGAQSKANDKAGEQPGATKPSNPPGKPDPSKPDAKDKSQPKQGEQGPGGEGGTNASKGENTKPGPKNNPTENTPKAKPDANDPGKKGPEGQTPSGQADSGKPPSDAEVTKGQGKGRGQPEPAPSKGEAKPDPNGGTPGTNGEKGDLQDAPKGSGPGAKPKSEPKTDGTAGGAIEKKDGATDKKMSPDEMVKKAADLAKKLAENAKDLKNAPAMDDKTRAEFEKKMAETVGDQKSLAEALRNADPKLKKELADNLEKLRKEMEKGEGGKPKSGEPKPSDFVNDLAKELGKPGDGKSDSQAKKSEGNPNPNDKDAAGDEKQAGTKAADNGNGMDLKAGPIGDQPRRPTGDMTGDQPDTKFAGKAGEMQLEEFKKKVDRKMLDELRMTEQEYAEFLRAYEAMVKRQKAQAEKNDRERGSTSGRSAANSGAKRVQAGNDKTNVERGGAALPPPEMREGYKGFTEDVSKSGTKPKDK